MASIYSTVIGLVSLKQEIEIIIDSENYNVSHLQ